MSKSRMAEVLRLTQAGRLAEATAMLGHGLAGPGAASSASMRPAPSREAISVEARLGIALKGLERFGVDLVGKGRSPAPVDADTPPSTKARFDDHRFVTRVGVRDYKLYRPASAGAEPLPLIVMLHGCQQSPADFAAGTRMNAIAEEFGLLVVYPEQSSAANHSRCWNWFVPNDQAREGGEPALIAGITREVMGMAAVDPSRVFVAGLSAGGAAAAIMGSTYPDLYAAVGVHSGLACGAARDMASAFSAMQGGLSPINALAHPLPIIVFHGDRDHTVNMVNGDRVIAQSMGTVDKTGAVTQGRSAGGVAYTRTVHSGPAGDPILEQWVLHGLGHAWSGGSAAGSFTDPRGPDASREMVRFFLGQALAAC